MINKYFYLLKFSTTSFPYLSECSRRNPRVPAFYR